MLDNTRCSRYLIYTRKKFNTTAIGFRSRGAMKVALLIAGVLPFLFGIDAAYRRVCYYENWAQYAPPPTQFFPESVDTRLCTHVIYSFATLQNNILKGTEWNDEVMFKRFTDLKKKNPGLKTLLSVGGWNMGSAKFSAMVHSPSTRRQFVITTITYLRNRNFDGLDVDWHFPAARGSPPEDKHRFVTMLKELQDAFKEESVRSRRPKLILSAAVPGGKHNIDQGFDIPAISRSLDMINLMTYDFHGASSSEQYTGFSSPLYKLSKETGDQTHLNLDWAAQYWVSQGAPRDKLNIGMGLYGHSFIMETPSAIRPGQSKASIGFNGTYGQEAGSIPYHKICQMLKPGGGGVRHWDDEQKVPYMVHGSDWVGYDDPQSLRIKVDYVKSNHFGGIMVWALSKDDYYGVCNETMKYPLLTAINKALAST